MTLAIFDLDETLIAADSCSLFCEYMVAEGIVDESFVKRDLEQMALYKAGQLDLIAYIDFFIGELSHLTTAQIDELLPKFIDTYIQPAIYPQAQTLLGMMRERDVRPLIISATAAFIVKPIASAFGISDYLAIELEEENHKYTGRIAGIPSFREGKVERLKIWLQAQGESLEGASFYSDSINDQPLLEFVDHPVATNPDQALTELAVKNSWPVLRWYLNDENAEQSVLQTEPTNPNIDQHFTNAEQTHV